MTLNKKRTQPIKVDQMKETAHANFMGGPSYDITSPLLRLICMSASSFFGEPSYYKGQRPKFKKRAGRVERVGGRPGRGDSLSGTQRKHLNSMLNAIDDYEWRSLSPADSMEKAITEALDHDPEATLQWAATLRRDEFIRATPQVILVMAANHLKVKGTGLIRQYAPAIIGRMDEPAIQLAFQLENYGKPIPNALKRAWADALNKANGYELAKYRMESRVVKTIDVINMAFGKGAYGFENPIGELARGELSLGDEYQTWESIRSNGGTWDEAIKVMGHMALLRNIRNLVKAGAPTELWLKKLVNTADRGKQLPFRYLSAHNANRNAPGHVLDAIEECLELSVGNLPTLNGRSLVLTDNSGSAHGCPVSELSTMTVAEIGNLMGVLTGMISDEGVLGVFGDRLEYVPIRKKASIMDQTTNANTIGRGIGGGTENGVWLALDDAIRNKKHWDNIFIYSDMQAGHGGLYGTDPSAYSQYSWKQSGYREYIDVAKLISTYRAKVNARVNVFLVQIAGYEDTLLPEFFDRTYIIGGWSDSIFKFAKRMIDTADQYSQ
jgi:hypothetical protein